MKFASFERGGRAAVGCVEDDRLVIPPALAARDLAAWLVEPRGVYEDRRPHRG